MTRAGEDLIGRARGGDETAFVELLEPLWDLAYRLAFAMLAQREAAEDAVQEAVLSAWRHRHNLREGTPSLRPWFLTIVANRCRSMRRSPWWRALPLPFPAPGLEISEGGAHEELVDLHRALARLRDDQRMALALHYYLDLPIDEVARVLGISRAAAKARVHRAVSALRPLLREVM